MLYSDTVPPVFTLVFISNELIGWLFVGIEITKLLKPYANENEVVLNVSENVHSQTKALTQNNRERFDENITFCIVLHLYLNTLGSQTDWGELRALR